MAEMSARLCCGREVVPMSEEWEAMRAQHHTPYKQGMMRILPEGWLIPTAFTHYADRVYNFKFRPSDVIVMGIPKSGTTWMQEVVWTMLHNPDLNNPKADTSIYMRAPDIEFDCLLDSTGVEDEMLEIFIKVFESMCPGRKVEDGMMVQMCEFLPDRRVMKTHLSLSLMKPDLLDKTKVIYIARNPKDVVVSFHHFFRLSKLVTYSGTFDGLFQNFIDDELFFTPFWPHVKLAWEKRHHPNLHFVFYEDIKADPMTEISKMNDFIGANLTEQQLRNVVQHNSFSAIKSRGEPLSYNEWKSDAQKNETGSFYRKGTTGDWKNHLTPEQDQRMNQWIESNSAGTDINFKYDS